MNPAVGEVRINEIQKEVLALNKKLNKIFAGDNIDYYMPDRMLPDWGRAKIKVNIPIDVLEVDNLKGIMEQASPALIRRKELRAEEASILLALGKITIEETVPE